VNTSTTYCCEFDDEKRQKFDIGILQAASQNLGVGSQSSTSKIQPRIENVIQHRCDMRGCPGGM